MKTISDLQINKTLTSTKEFENDILKNEDIRKFIRQNKIPKKEFNSNFGLFLVYLDKIEQCQNCLGLHLCAQNIVGRKPILEKKADDITINYVPCNFEKKYQAIVSKEQNLILIGVSRNDYDNIQLFINDNRRIILDEIKRYLENYPKQQKGIYLSGPYGCGKTYIFTHLTKMLIEKGAQVIFAYYPSLVSLIKSKIGTSSFDRIIDDLKTVEILILDDFGGEMSSSYVRDEILGPILQERMVHNRALFMTSNLDTETLQEHLAESNKEVDRVRALRIYERLKTLMDFMELKDRNYR